MKIDIGILGMGYVGLPLAIAMAEKYKVIGFNVDENRISSLKMGIDKKTNKSKNRFNLFK